MVKGDYSTIPALLSLSILLEASAYPKPGNTHRLSNIESTPYEAFLATGCLSTRWFTKGYKRGFKKLSRVVFGDVIYGLVRDVMEATATNTCLGSATLLAPLSVSIGLSIKRKCVDINCFTNNVSEVLEKTTIYDTIYFYKAVRVANPSHLKETDKTNGVVNVWSRSYVKDIVDSRIKLVEVFKYSASREVVHDEVLGKYKRSKEALVYLQNRLEHHGDWNRGVVETYLYLLSNYIDTLIARKHGVDQAYYVKERAGEVLEQVIYRPTDWLNVVFKFDDELKVKKLNPGSIADLTVSTVALHLLKKYIEKRRIP